MASLLGGTCAETQRDGWKLDDGRRNNKRRKSCLDSLQNQGMDGCEVSVANQLLGEVRFDLVKFGIQLYAVYEGLQERSGRTREKKCSMRTSLPRSS